MGTSITVVPGAGFTSATATLNPAAADAAGFVTFTTASTIPASPYKIFTLTFASSWTATYATPPVLVIFPCANPGNARSAAQMLAVAALGPFYCIPSSLYSTVDVYCTNAPATTTAYDIAYCIGQGP